jgi:hypothetical protein
MSSRDLDNNKPTISVVIPLYNKESYIVRAITSALSQNYPPLEVIVVDDGSTDNGPKLVQSVHDPRVKIVCQENRGPGAARNRGLALAKGQYISFLDADDEWDPMFLESAMAFLQKHPSCSLVATGYTQSPSGDPNSKGLRHLEGEYESSNITIEVLNEIVIFNHLCFTVIKTDIARKFGGYFDKFRCIHGEDTYFLVKMLFNERIGIISECLGIYHREASDLDGRGYDSPPPIAPLFSHPDEIYRMCPTSKLSMLNEWLAGRALRASKYYSKLGEGKTARYLINRFCKSRGQWTSEILQAKVLAWAAPVLPGVGSAWRIWKRIRGYEI